VGSFELSEELGHGGMGVVFRAEQKAFARLWTDLAELLKKTGGRNEMTVGGHPGP
jgi:hypothetical protein